MAYTALTDAALAGREPAKMDWILECRSGAQARAGGDWTAIKIVGTPTMDRGGMGLCTSTKFDVARIHVSSRLMDSAAANSDVTLVATWRYPGPFAGEINCAFVDPGAENAALAVSKECLNITVSLATDGAGNIISTAAEVAAAMNAHPKVGRMVVATAEGDGSGVVDAISKTYLVFSGRLSYTDDYDPENPLQTGSAVRIKCRVYVNDPCVYEEEYVFRGYAAKITIEDAKLSVIADDRLAVCKRALAEVSLESPISNTFTGSLTLEAIPGTKNLRLPIASYPEAWWDDGGTDALRSWKGGPVHIYEVGATDPLPTESWKAFFQEGIITLAETPVGPYELRQDGMDYTLKVYAMGDEDDVITVGRALQELLLCDKWVTKGGGLIETGHGPGFLEEELILSPGMSINSFVWTKGSGSVLDAINELISNRFSGNYKLFYDPASDKIIGWDEADFNLKAYNVMQETPPVYEIAQLYKIKHVNQERFLDDVNADILVKGLAARPEAILKPSDSAKITVLLDPDEWNEFGTIQPFSGWDAIGNLLNGKWGQPNGSIGLAKWKAGAVGDGPIDFIEIDLEAPMPVSQIMLAGPVGNTSVTEVQVWIYVKAAVGDEYCVIGSCDGAALSVKEAKAFEVTGFAQIQFVKVAMRAAQLRGGKASWGIIGLAEIQVHGADTLSQIVFAQETDEANTNTYYPNLIDKYYECGLPVQVDDYDLVRTAEQLISRGEKLVYWGVRNARGYIVESDQPDPRALLYKTTKVTCLFNEPDGRPMLIEYVELSSKGMRIEGTDYYSEPVKMA